MVLKLALGDTGLGGLLLEVLLRRRLGCRLELGDQRSNGLDAITLGLRGTRLDYVSIELASIGINANLTHRVGNQPNRPLEILLGDLLGKPSSWLRPCSRLYFQSALSTINSQKLPSRAMTPLGTFVCAICRERHYDTKKNVAIRSYFPERNITVCDYCWDEYRTNPKYDHLRPDVEPGEKVEIEARREHMRDTHIFY
ncbi:MAG: hypothetical protein U5J98_07050 [Halobacteriales archaeon]|nr:hypothetical protein [Halobacteriales archaeon]